jgi:hypothetical protein
MMVGGDGSVNLTGWNELWILPEIYKYYAVQLMSMSPTVPVLTKNVGKSWH